MVDREATCQWLVKLANILGEEEKTGDEITFRNLKAFHSRILDVMALLLDLPAEPRVMTLEEAKSAFVIEYRSGKLKEAGMKILDLDVDPANVYYGVIYRVWTSRPDEKRRAEAPWDS